METSILPTLEMSKQKQWNETIAMVKKYKDIHLFYSSADGWANLAYKQRRTRIDYTMSEGIIEIKLRWLLA